jgi:hypothetical protein
MMDQHVLYASAIFRWSYFSGTHISKSSFFLTPRSEKGGNTLFEITADKMSDMYQITESDINVRK